MNEGKADQIVKVMYYFVQYFEILDKIMDLPLIV